MSNCTCREVSLRREESLVLSLQIAQLLSVSDLKKNKSTTCGDAEMKKESSRDCDRGGSQVDSGEIDQSPNDHY